MHRIKSADPGEDTRMKLEALGQPPRGRCLDVCTGLGYTAIALADCVDVESVITIELDPTMVEIQRRNPWSAKLFQSEKIERLIGDAVEVLPTFEDDSFDVVIYDPPAQAMSGELYTLEVYQQLRRILRRKGKLYHYIGDPESKESGRLFKGVMKRLREAGYGTVKPVKFAYGVVAV